jgi:hypothetical protein
MSDDAVSAFTHPIDAIDHDAMAAGTVHLDRAAAHLDGLRHQLDLAAACSDLCALEGTSDSLQRLETVIALGRGMAASAMERSVARAGATGIRARRSLPSPTYDHLFRLITDRRRTLCVMVPGYLGYDPDYWEEVPPDAGSASSAR